MLIGDFLLPISNSISSPGITFFHRPTANSPTVKAEKAAGTGFSKYSKLLAGISKWRFIQSKAKQYPKRSAQISYF